MQMQQCNHLEQHQPFDSYCQCLQWHQGVPLACQPPQDKPEVNFTPLRTRATLNLLALLLSSITQLTPQQKSHLALQHCTGVCSKTPGEPWQSTPERGTATSPSAGVP